MRQMYQSFNRTEIVQLIFQRLHAAHGHVTQVPVSGHCQASMEIRFKLIPLAACTPFLAVCLLLMSAGWCNTPQRLQTIEKLRRSNLCEPLIGFYSMGPVHAARLEQCMAMAAFPACIAASTSEPE